MKGPGARGAGAAGWRGFAKTAFEIEGDATVSGVIGPHGPEVPVRGKAAAERLERRSDVIQPVEDENADATKRKRKPPSSPKKQTVLRGSVY